MTTKVYLIRHGDVKNPRQVCYGRLPRFGLSEKGKAQAQKLNEYFKDKKISKIYSSPLLRSRQTAQIISDGKLPIGYSKSFIEIGLKSFQGKSWDFAISTRNNVMKRHKFPDESYQNVQTRVVNKIIQLVKRHAGENIIVTSHADPILTAQLYYKRIPIERLNGESFPNGAMTILEFNDILECIKVEFKNIVGSKSDF